jgi:hypothetical protein
MRCRQFRLERARAPDVDVDAGIGRGRLDVERLCRRPQRLGERPRRRDHAGEARGQDRTAVDRHDVMGLTRGEADLQNLVRCAAGVQHGAPSARAMGIDEVPHLRRDPGPAQCIDQEVALPGAIVRGLPVLERAAAADGEMRTDRRDALRARGLDAQQMGAIGMAGPPLDLHRLAGQRVGDVDRPGRRDAVALPADMIDGQALNQDEHPGRIRGCRRHR